MAETKKKPDKKLKVTTVSEKQPVEKEEVKKGYNEKNPTQPQGAFKPDSAK